MAKKRTAASAAKAGDGRVEDFLDRFNVNWEFHPDMPIGMWDKEGSLKNQARFHKVDPEIVTRYATNMRNGVNLPPVVATPTGPERKLQNLDGNHRMMAALEAGIEFLDVYIVLDASASKRTVMAQAANAEHGLPLGHEERLRHAIWLTQSETMKAAQAAATFGLNPAVVARHIAKATTARRAIDNNIPQKEWESLAVTVQTRLGQVITAEGFRAAAKLAYAAALNVDQVNDMVKTVNASSSATEQVELVGTFEECYADRIREKANGMLNGSPSGAGTSPRSRIMMGLGQIKAARLAENVGQVVRDFSPQELPEVVEKVQAGRDQLDTFLDVAHAVLEGHNG